MWHHEHHFEEKDGGVLMTDLLYYAISYGPLGNLANWLVVDNKIEKVFAYRFEGIERHFGK